MASDNDRIYFTPSEQVRLYLGQIKSGGVYGKKRSDVINYILGKEIQRMLEGNALTRLPIAPQDDQEEE